MISLHRIVRLACTPSADGSNAALLLDEILASTRPLPLAARLRLEADETLPAVAIGLGLSRFIDLTFAHSQHTVELAERLMAHQNEAGSFGSVSASAVASSALLSAAHQFERGIGDHAQSMAKRCALAAEAALAWLSEQLTPAPAVLWEPLDALFDTDDDAEPAFDHPPVMACEPIEAAIALWQLAPHAEARQRIDVESLLSLLEQAGVRHDRAVAQLIERAGHALSGTLPQAQPALSSLTEAA